MDSSCQEMKEFFNLIHNKDRKKNSITQPPIWTATKYIPIPLLVRRGLRQNALLGLLLFIHSYTHIETTSRCKCLPEAMNHSDDQTDWKAAMKSAFLLPVPLLFFTYQKFKGNPFTIPLMLAGSFLVHMDNGVL